MEFFLDIRIEEPHYNALITFIATFNAKDEEDARLFYEELVNGFLRRKAVFRNANYFRIDNDPLLHKRSYENYQFHLSHSTSSIKVEQFFVEAPDQSKSLADNLIKKFFDKEDSTALIGKQYDIPVRVVDKETRQPIRDEYFYYTVEHLIPKN